MQPLTAVTRYFPRSSRAGVDSKRRSVNGRDFAPIIGLRPIVNGTATAMSTRNTTTTSNTTFDARRIKGPPSEALLCMISVRTTSYLRKPVGSGGRSMLKRISIGVAFALLLATTVAAQMWPTKSEQQGNTANGAPKVRNEWYIDSAAVAVAYSRPSLKGRALDAVVAKDTPWLAGDDEPATLTANKPLIFGN